MTNALSEKFDQIELKTDLKPEEKKAIESLANIDLNSEEVKNDIINAIDGKIGAKNFLKTLTPEDIQDDKKLANAMKESGIVTFEGTGKNYKEQGLKEVSYLLKMYMKLNGMTVEPNFRINGLAQIIKDNKKNITSIPQQNISTITSTIAQAAPATFASGFPRNGVQEGKPKSSYELTQSSLRASLAKISENDIISGIDFLKISGSLKTVDKRVQEKIIQKFPKLLEAFDYGLVGVEFRNGKIVGANFETPKGKGLLDSTLGNGMREDGSIDSFFPNLERLKIVNQDGALGGSIALSLLPAIKQVRDNKLKSWIDVEDDKKVLILLNGEVKNNAEVLTHYQDIPVRTASGDYTIKADQYTRPILTELRSGLERNDTEHPSKITKVVLDVFDGPIKTTSYGKMIDFSPVQSSFAQNRDNFIALIPNKAERNRLLTLAKQGKLAYFAFKDGKVVDVREN